MSALARQLAQPSFVATAGHASTPERLLRGELHRMPNTRLADHLSMQKGGVISVTNAFCERTKEELGYVVIMLSSVLFIQESENDSTLGGD